MSLGVKLGILGNFALGGKKDANFTVKLKI
jgi:hypothetical protein